LTASGWLQRVGRRIEVLRVPSSADGEFRRRGFGAQITRSPIASRLEEPMIEARIPGDAGVIRNDARIGADYDIVRRAVVAAAGRADDELGIVLTIICTLRQIAIGGRAAGGFGHGFRVTASRQDWGERLGIGRATTGGISGGGHGCAAAIPESAVAQTARATGDSPFHCGDRSRLRRSPGRTRIGGGVRRISISSAEANIQRQPDVAGDEDYDQQPKPQSLYATRPHPPKLRPGSCTPDVSRLKSKHEAWCGKKQIQSIRCLILTDRRRQCNAGNRTEFSIKPIRSLITHHSFLATLHTVCVNGTIRCLHRYGVPRARSLRPALPFDTALA
jgi:hypothetical protein